MTTPLEQGELTPPVEDADHRAGPHDAPVTLVEFGDYECPYTRQAQPTVEEIRARLGRQLCFVFRQYPLAQLHPHARAAAEAAEAAAAQANFWPMHAELFSEPLALEHEDLLEHARRAGVEDLDRFRGELADHAYAPQVDADLESGTASGVPGTPTFFINGRRYDGPVEAEGMARALISAAEERVRAGER
jgi:NhaA family Na+:H+ antiporter